MIKLEEMWRALGKYQKYAEAADHGDTWAALCEERTDLAAYNASCGAEAMGQDGANKAAAAATRVAHRSADGDGIAVINAQRAIDFIEDAIRIKDMRR